MLDFTVDMLKRASARRQRSDQVDKHIISLATGISYNDLGLLTQREYGVYTSELIDEVQPYFIRLSWESESEKWSITHCSCQCECDECSFIMVCGVCDCGGSEICLFREVIQNDIERVNLMGKPDYIALVEIVAEIPNLVSWRLKKYKTVEMAVVRSMMAPLPGTPS